MRKSEGGRHPGGRTCNGMLPLAIVLTIVQMWKHRREVAEYIRHGD